MKKEIRIVVLVYIVVAVLTYVTSLRFDRLSNVESENQNRTIVLKLK